MELLESCSTVDIDGIGDGLDESKREKMRERGMECKRFCRR